MKCAACGSAANATGLTPTPRCVDCYDEWGHSTTQHPFEDWASLQRLKRAEDNALRDKSAQMSKSCDNCEQPGHISFYNPDGSLGRACGECREEFLDETQLLDWQAFTSGAPPAGPPECHCENYQYHAPNSQCAWWLARNA